MADDNKRKPRREVLYDRARRAAKPEEAPAPEEAAGAAAGETLGEASATHMDMFKRHEADRRTMHGNHRGEHRAIERDGGGEVLKKKMAAHRRQLNEMNDMHERHEQELLAQLATMHRGEQEEAA